MDKEENGGLETYTRKSIELSPTVGQKNLRSKLIKQCVRLMLAKNYDNESSDNEFTAKCMSAFLKSSINFLNQRCPLSASIYV